MANNNSHPGNFSYTFNAGTLNYRINGAPYWLVVTNPVTQTKFETHFSYALLDPTSIWEPYCRHNFILGGEEFYNHGRLTILKGPGMIKNKLSWPSLGTLGYNENYMFFLESFASPVKIEYKYKDSLDD